MTKVCEHIPGVSFRNYHLADLENADDTILLSNSICQLRDALTTYQQGSAELGIQMSWVKTKLMHVGEGPDPPQLYIGPDAVEFIRSFIYLGSTATNNGDLPPEINRRHGLTA